MPQPPRPPSSEATLPRRRIQEALQMFSEIQNTPITDLEDVERIRASSSSAPSRKNVLRTDTETSKSSSRSLDQLAQLKHKVDVSDVLMKKLHRRNQELCDELAQLRAGGHNSVALSSEVAQVQALRKDIAEKDALIRQLKNSLSERQSAPHNSSTNSPSKVAALDAALSRRLKTLERQYEDLLGVKIDCVREGESTGKINKEVKAFFVTMKRKVYEDAASRELERNLVNEYLFELEQKLCGESVT